jgi:mannitol 2-dehydrogenase
VGVDVDGERIRVVVRLADTLTAIASTQRDDPLAFVANRELFGDLVDEPAFTEPYRAALESLHLRGSRATLEALS